MSWKEKAIELWKNRQKRLKKIKRTNLDSYIKTIEKFENELEKLQKKYNITRYDIFEIILEHENKKVM